MKNKREYYPSTTRAWIMRRDDILARKYQRAKQVMEVAKMEALEAEIGEPVKLILKLMKEDPRRFKVDISGYVNSWGGEVRQSTDKRTGHKIKVAKSTRSYGERFRLSGEFLITDVYFEENNPWMTQGERVAIYNALGDIVQTMRMQDEEAKHLAAIKRKEEGRSRVMEMYKREMK